MATSEAASLYCWNGKTKVANSWTLDTEEPELCPANANCSVYLSEEQSLQETPSFRIRFDNLVTRQCQPLIRALFCDEPMSATTSSTSQLSLPASTATSRRSSSSSSSCSLLLHPPHTANEFEASQYNVTTRNFFAWIIGAPIVGTDPAVALIALKARMDTWRNASCDNIAAVQQYAKQQGYTEPLNLHLATELALQSAVSSAAEYKMSSAPMSKFSKSTSNATMRLTQSLGRRAGAMMKRKSEVMKSHDGLQSNENSSQIASSESKSCSKRPGLHSNVSSDDSDHSSSVGFGQANTSADGATSSSCTTHSCSSHVSKRSTLSLNTSIPYTPLELPELEDILQPYWSGDDHSDKGKGNEAAMSQAAYTASLRQSPTFTESPRAYSNSFTRHSSQRDRRGPRSRAGSGPPSPILEEVTLSRTTHPTTSANATNKRPRRFSFESVSDYPDHGQTSAHSATTTPPVRPTLYTSNSMATSSSYATAASHPQIICTACKRRKKPDSASTSRTQLVNPDVTETIPPVPPLPAVVPGPADEKSSSTVDAPAQHEAIAAQKFRISPSIKARLNGEGQLDHRRFPSLYGLRTGSKSSSDVTTITPSPAFISRSSTVKRPKTTTQTSGTRFRSRTISEGVNSDQIPTRRGSIGTPLTEQRHTSSTRSSTLTKRRMSHDTVRVVPTGVPVPGSPAPVDEYSLDVKLDEVQVQQKPTTSPKRTTSSKPPASMKRATAPAPVRVTSPEPSDFPVLMKSNGSRHPLALMLQNENTCMVVSTSSPPDKHQPHFSTVHRDDTIMLDRLLEGFKFLDYPPPPTPTYRSKTPTRTITPYADSAASPGRSSQLSPTSPRCTSSASVRSSWTSRTSRKSWTGSLRRWKSKDPSLMDMEDPLEVRPLSKNGSIQIRVLSMDSTGKFSTEYMDSPDELGTFPDFR